jgi:type II secretory pathway pseudopilin PulG
MWGYTEGNKTLVAVVVVIIVVAAIAYVARRFWRGR